MKIILNRADKKNQPIVKPVFINRYKTIVPNRTAAPIVVRNTTAALRPRSFFRNVNTTLQNPKRKIEFLLNGKTWKFHYKNFMEPEVRGA